MNNHVPASCDLHVLLEAIAGPAQECRLTVGVTKFSPQIWHLVLLAWFKNSRF